jgi:glutamine amidotransferase
MIAIVDYNMGNLRSVQNAFDKIGESAVVQKDPDRLKDYDKLILPGVGAFGDAIKHLKKSGLDEALIEYADSGKPFLGVCLGMQLLFNSSCEFGSHKGLGLIDGEVELFDKSRFKTPLKVPHMGWNEIETNSSALFKGLDEKFYLYFVHSYHVKTDEKFIIGKTHYGYDFASAVQRDNIFGFQPHPEKSHENGLKILKNFTDI